MIYHLQTRPMIFQGAAGQFPFVLLLTNLAANGSDRCNLVWEWRWKMGYQDILQTSSDLLFSNYPVFWGLILSNTHLIGHGAWNEICHENRIRFAPGIWMICWTYITIAGSNIIFCGTGAMIVEFIFYLMGYLSHEQFSVRESQSMNDAPIDQTVTWYITASNVSWAIACKQKNCNYATE